MVQSFSGQDVIPILFLYRHSFELQLKKVRYLLDENEGVKSEHPRHDISSLIDDLCKRIPKHFSEDQHQDMLNPLSQRLEYLKEKFMILYKVDPVGTTFRYDDHKYQMPRFDLKQFMDTARSCAETLDELINGLGAFLDAKNENY